VPQEVTKRRAKPYMHSGKPVHRGERIHDNDGTIIKTYQQEYRGIVNYWRMAYNLREMGKLRWIMQQSLMKTLAAKYKTSITKLLKKYEAEEIIEGRKCRVLKAVITRPGKAPVVGIWGGVTLAWNPEATLNDQPARIWNGRTELVQRLLADECEYCGSNQFVEVHHIRGLKDLNVGRSRTLPAWKKLMSARRRKTMVVCRECHHDIEHGLPMRNPPSGKGFMHNPKEWQKTHRKGMVSRAV
jgi:hypothetical protein